MKKSLLAILIASVLAATPVYADDAVSSNEAVASSEAPQSAESAGSSVTAEDPALVGNDYAAPWMSASDQYLTHVSSVDDASEYIARSISDHHASVEFIYDDVMGEYPNDDTLSNAIANDVIRKFHLPRRTSSVKQFCRIEWSVGGIGEFDSIERKVHYTRGWSIPVYRLYNKKTGDHRYTTSSSEVDTLKRKGWRYEGKCWTADTADYGYPVYAVENPNTGDYHYTLNIGERKYLIKMGWKDRGVAFYESQMDTVPLYRLYNPNARTGAHHYTKSANEKNALVRLGWRYEGIAWYVF